MLDARPPDTPSMPISRQLARGKSGSAGHPWIYRSDVAETRRRAGDIVRVVGPRGRPLGHALFSDDPRSRCGC